MRSLTSGQYVTHCPKRDDHKKNENGASFLEYNMNSAESRTQLVNEIEQNMVVTRQYDKNPVGLHGQLRGSQYKSSFIIKEAITPADCLLGSLGIGRLSMRRMLFKIDFIGACGVVDKKMEGTWITGNVLGEIIGAAGRSQKPKPKFVYDHTSASGSSVRFAGVLSQMSQELPHHMSQGLCIIET